MQPDPPIVARLFDAVARQVHSSHASADLAAGQWAILRHLNQQNPNGRTAEHMATYFSEPLIGMKRALTSLVRKGLLVSAADADDVNVRYALTVAGEEMIARDPVAFSASAIARMSASDRAEFARLLEIMLAGLTPSNQ